MRIKRAEGKYMSIGELARVMDVSIATIRSWEKRYGWPSSARTKGSHRRYKRSDLPVYRAVRQLRTTMSTKQAVRELRRPLKPRQR